MRVWAVANQKGGVGKTTTAVTLAGLLAQQGQRVLLLDLDPHGSLTAYFGLDPDTLSDSLYQLFEQAAGNRQTLSETLIQTTAFEGLSLLPASTALATLDRQLGTRDGMGLVISRYLNQLQGRFDYVMMDCPPVVGVLMINALAACERLIIPVQTEFLALKGLERMLHTLNMVVRSRKQTLPYTIVPALFDRRTRASIDSLRSLRNHYPEWVWSGVIPVDTQFREASRVGAPISHGAPKSRGTQAYQSLLTMLLSGNLVAGASNASHLTG